MRLRKLGVQVQGVPGFSSHLLVGNSGATSELIESCARARPNHAIAKLGSLSMADWKKPAAWRKDSALVVFKACIPRK
jgi:hypothetical protein